MHHGNPTWILHYMISSFQTKLVNKTKKIIQSNHPIHRFLLGIPSNSPKLPRETRSLKVFLHLPNGRRGDVDAGDLLISRGVQFRWECRISATDDQEIPGTITSHGTKLFKGILGVAFPAFLEPARSKKKTEGLKVKRCITRMLENWWKSRKNYASIDPNPWSKNPL